MKKTLFLALGFALVASMASAGTGKWELQLGEALRYWPLGITQLTTLGWV